MPRPDPALLRPERYPFRLRIEPRFGDLDVNMHVNNVAVAALVAEARVRFHHAWGYRDNLSGVSPMAASITIEYLGQGSYPDPIEACVGLETLGRTSHTVATLLVQSGAPFAFARAIMVSVGADGPVVLPDALKAAAEPWKLQP
jgi:acyl-CoA thioester hydrolase